MSNSGAAPVNQGAVAQVTNVANQATTGAVNAVAQATNAAAQATTGAVNAAANLFKNISSGVNKAANSVSKNFPSFNSLVPLGNSPPAQANAPNTKSFNMGFGAATSPAVNAAAASVAAPATLNNFSMSKITGSPWAIPLMIFVALVVTFLVVFSVFNRQIKQGYNYLASSFKKSMGLSAQPSVMAEIVPIQGTVHELTVPPVAPQTVTPQQVIPQSVVEKVLPPSGINEVYNVTQNKFTYYDAEPLCKALGAELATYEQVKEAWGKGADWCNYGWVKGQMAIYPTQKETYDKLQAGPADQHNACGTTGINGGFFDNADMRYGVNCYGKKPSQSAHDEQMLMEEGKVAKTPQTLKVDQMVAEFKTEVDSLYVKPFSDSKWSTT